MGDALSLQAAKPKFELGKLLRCKAKGRGSKGIETQGRTIFEEGARRAPGWGFVVCMSISRRKGGWCSFVPWVYVLERYHLSGLRPLEAPSIDLLHPLRSFSIHVTRPIFFSFIFFVSFTIALLCLD